MSLLEKETSRERLLRLVASAHVSGHEAPSECLLPRDGVTPDPHAMPLTPGRGVLVRMIEAIQQTSISKRAEKERYGKENALILDPSSQDQLDAVVPYYAAHPKPTDQLSMVTPSKALHSVYMDIVKSRTTSGVLSRIDRSTKPAGSLVDGVSVGGSTHAISETAMLVHNIIRGTKGVSQSIKTPPPELWDVDHMELQLTFGREHPTIEGAVLPVCSRFRGSGVDMCMTYSASTPAPGALQIALSIDEQDRWQKTGEHPDHGYCVWCWIFLVTCVSEDVAERTPGRRAAGSVGQPFRNPVGIPSGYKPEYCLSPENTPGLSSPMLALRPEHMVIVTHPDGRQAFDQSMFLAAMPPVPDPDFH